MKPIAIFVFLMMLMPMAKSENLLPIEAFGPEGQHAAKFLGQPLSADFYTKSQMAAMMDGRNFTAVLSLAQLNAQREASIAETPEGTFERSQTRLFLANLSDQDAAVVISAEKADGIANFVVNVPAADEQALDISSLTDFENLYLLSVSDFQAVVDSDMLSDEASLLEAQVHEPRVITAEEQTGKSVNYCSNQYGVRIRMCGFDSLAGQWVCVTSYAYRYHGGNNNYFLDVHYPIYGAVFHYGVGSFNSVGLCKAGAHTTYAPATLKSLEWFGMADLMLNVSSAASANNFSNKSERWYISRF